MVAIIFSSTVQLYIECSTKLCIKFLSYLHQKMFKHSAFFLLWCWFCSQIFAYNYEYFFDYSINKGNIFIIGLLYGCVYIYLNNKS